MTTKREWSTFLCNIEPPILSSICHCRPNPKPYSAVFKLCKPELHSLSHIAFVNNKMRLAKNQY